MIKNRKRLQGSVLCCLRGASCLGECRKAGTFVRIWDPAKRNHEGREEEINHPAASYGYLSLVSLSRNAASSGA